MPLDDKVSDWGRKSVRASFGRPARQVSGQNTSMLHYGRAHARHWKEGVSKTYDCVPVVPLVFEKFSFRASSPVLHFHHPPPRSHRHSVAASLPVPRFRSHPSSVLLLVFFLQMFLFAIADCHAADARRGVRASILVNVQGAFDPVFLIRSSTLNIPRSFNLARMCTASWLARGALDSEPSEQGVIRGQGWNRLKTRRRPLPFLDGYPTTPLEWWILDVFGAAIRAHWSLMGDFVEALLDAPILTLIVLEDGASIFLGVLGAISFSRSKNVRKSPPPAAPKLGGFMAYASTSSPFASVKGQNIFGQKKPTASVPFATSNAVTPGTSSPFTAAPNEPASPPSSTKRAVFGSSTSPFAASAKAKQDVLGSTSKLVRAKSPPRRATPAGINAFSSYASGGAQGFALAVPKRVRSGSPDDSGASSLERVTSVVVGNGSAGSSAEDEHDDRPISFVMTGEEDEETLHQVRGKLYSLVDGNQWKERGTGTIKLNVRRSDGGGARLVMRKEAVYTVLLNVTLFHGMRCTLAQDPRYLRLSVLEGGVATHYNLRVGSAKSAQELPNEINANLPAA
ncbi:hypothetical protein DFH06DRAFT_1358957 [Mycena polygramma]|nr:hypothetical protein DFH06DRAFT_1358957 [Mycena polygramma]